MELKLIATLNHSCRISAFNRTKWNWNVLLLYSSRIPKSFNRTKWNWNDAVPLVVIDRTTFNRTKWNWNKPKWIRVRIISHLLIVLNGIETQLSISWTFHVIKAFNRTKWNWNEDVVYFYNNVESFNRTKWNWNGMKIYREKRGCTLLIVLNGIETCFGAFFSFFL